MNKTTYKRADSIVSIEAVKQLKWAVKKIQTNLREDGFDEADTEEFIEIIVEQGKEQ